MTSVDWNGLGGGVLDDLFTADRRERGPDFGDRYEVGEVIGSGGQGVVYAAYDRTCDRQVAIKRLHDPAKGGRRLLAEARILSRLGHSAIPQLYDQGRSPDGGYFVVMRRIDGIDLDQYLRQSPPDLPARLLLFRAIAAAVAHAHRHGYLHRDLKPQNILVDAAGEPCIVDWGLAADGGPRAVCGSPHFAAPEQLDGQVADRRADVYALGVLLYTILTGELPYGRSVKNFQEFRRLRAGLQRVPLRARRPELPAALERLCDTAMAAQPAARFQTVELLLSDLDALMAGRPLARDLPILPWRRLAVVALVLLAASSGFFAGHWTAPESPPPGLPSRLLPPPVSASWPLLPRSQADVDQLPVPDWLPPSLPVAPPPPPALAPTVPEVPTRGFFAEDMTAADFALLHTAAATDPEPEASLWLPELEELERSLPPAPAPPLPNLDDSAEAAVQLPSLEDLSRQLPAEPAAVD